MNKLPDYKLYWLVVACLVIVLGLQVYSAFDSISTQQEICEQVLAEEMLQLADNVIQDSLSVNIDGVSKEVIIYDGTGIVATGTLLSTAPGCFYPLVDSK